MPTHQRLTTLPGALRAAGYPAPAYSRLRFYAIDCVYPAFQVNHHWHWEPAHLHQIAAALGLTADTADRVAA